MYTLPGAQYHVRIVVGTMASDVKLFRGQHSVVFRAVKAGCTRGCFLLLLFVRGEVLLVGGILPPRGVTGHPALAPVFILYMMYCNTNVVVGRGRHLS